MIRVTTAPPPAQGDSVRLFFALSPDPGVRAALARLARAIADATGARAPRTENIHLTLAFLGSVSHARLAELAAIGRSAAATHAPFSLRLDRLGLFRAAGVAWVAPRATCAPLSALHDALRESLERIGLPLEERDFTPHVTLARRAKLAPAGVEEPCIEWDVDGVALMQSEPGPHGVVYRELAHWPLTGPAT